MNDFKDFGITTSNKSYKGDKIKIERLLNREIVVHECKLEDSIKVPGTDCLHMQISINDIYYVVFTGSKGIMEQIAQVPKNGFPFKGIIIKENDWLKFKTK